MKIERVTPQNWSLLSEHAHKAVFGTVKPASQDRIDYALLAVDPEKNQPVGYLTAREIDSDTVYWQFGGAFTPIKGTLQSFSIYRQFIEWTRPRYKRVTTLIENTNLPMLKFAMKVGFKILGIRTYAGSVLLEHVLELQEGV